MAKLRIFYDIAKSRKIVEEKSNILRLQFQLASAKLAICLKNSVLGFEKLSFFSWPEVEFLCHVLDVLIRKIIEI